MSLVIPPGYGLAAFTLTGPAGTQPYITTCGVDLDAAGGDWEQAANSAFAAFAQEVCPYINDALTLDRVQLTVGSDGPGGSVDSTLPPEPCGATGAFAPTAMSAIIRKQTANLGRTGRGRFFMPGVLQETWVEDNGQISTDGITALSTMAVNFYGALSEGSDDPLFSTPLPPVLLHSEGDIQPPTVITAFSVTNVVGWIRGRIR